MQRDPSTDRHLVRPAVFVASLLDYDYGVVHGRWVYADTSSQQLSAAINQVLVSSPTATATGEIAEEWIVLDHEGFGEHAPDEHDPPYEIVRLALEVANIS